MGCLPTGRNLHPPAVHLAGQPIAQNCPDRTGSARRFAGNGECEAGATLVNTIETAKSAGPYLFPGFGIAFGMRSRRDRFLARWVCDGTGVDELEALCRRDDRYQDGRRRDPCGRALSRQGSG